MHAVDNEHLVDGKYGIADLVDLDELRRIFERFTEATGFTIGFLDHPGLNVLIATGWRDICTKFHRLCPQAAAICTSSNRHLLDQLDEPGKLVIEPCDNGLVDCAFPIIVKGKHIASLATGQLLLEKPDRERFRRQARRFGVDEDAYLRALDEIPVISEARLRSVTTFLGEMAIVFTQLGYAHLTAKDEAERLENEIAVRKEAERALAAERERLLVTLRSIGDGVITTDTRGCIVLMNQVAETLTGWSLAESAGRPLHDVFNIINEKTRETCVDPVSKVMRTGQIVALANHTALICRDGRERLIADSGAPIRDQGGDIVGVVLVFRDVTDRRKAEMTLRNAQRIQSLGILASGIAHDFNNYLGGILGHVDLALDSAQAGDAAQAVHELAQVIQNLVLNAQESMPRGGGVRVSVASETVGESHPVMSPGCYVRISVQDGGEGIAAEIMPHIFDPFFTTKPSGSGLGLAICYSIVKKHSGYMEATSQEGKGTEFVVYLPAVMQPPKTDRQPEPGRGHRGRGTALVMDDEVSLRAVTSAMLQRMGYETATAKDGAEALKLLSERPFQLVVLDLTIPGGMGGIETAREIRKRYADTITVIAMTGYSEARVITAPGDCGFDGGLAKPFTMVELAGLLNRIASPRSR